MLRIEDMTVDQWLYMIIFTVCLITAAIVCTKVFVIPRYKRKTKTEKIIENAKRNGYIAEAKYLKHIYKAGSYGISEKTGNSRIDRDGFYVKYEYEVKGKKYRINAFQEDLYDNKGDIPPVEVYYDPTNPKRAYLEGCGERSKDDAIQRGCLMSVITFIVAMIICVKVLDRIFGAII